MFNLHAVIRVQSNLNHFSMPLFYQQNINETTQMAIWCIQEPLDFFEISIPETIVHQSRQIQYAAARYVLKTIAPSLDIHSLKYASSGKPFDPLGKIFFSLSHCNGYAAAIVCEHASVGIDIEIVHERINKVGAKFLHSSEIQKIDQIENSQQLMQKSFIWAAKEAMYKMNEVQGIDFAKKLVVNELAISNQGTVNAIIKQEGEDKMVQLKYTFDRNFVCVCSFE